MSNPFEMPTPEPTFKDIFRIADLERQHLTREYTFNEKNELQELYLNRWLHKKLLPPVKPKKAA